VGLDRIMSTANYDASLVTKMRQARTLYAARVARNAAVAAGTSVLPEQGPPPLESVRADRNLGAIQLIRWSDGPGKTTVDNVLHNGCTACATTAGASSNGQ
jgi:hypothetical protein